MNLAQAIGHIGHGIVDVLQLVFNVLVQVVGKFWLVGLNTQLFNDEFAVFKLAVTLGKQLLKKLHSLLL